MRKGLLSRSAVASASAAVSLLAQDIFNALFRKRANVKSNEEAAEVEVELFPAILKVKYHFHL